MRCVDDGRLRAFLDDEVGGLTATARAAIEAHLRDCPSCARRAQAARAEATVVAGALASWLPLTPANEQQAGAALARFQATIRQEERDKQVASVGLLASFKEWAMQNFRHLNAARTRRVSAVIAMMAIIGLVLALSPVSSLADQLFKTFRVQQFQAITVRVPNMKELPQPREMTQAERDQIAALLKPLGTPTTNATKDSFREVADQVAAKDFFTKNGGKLYVPKNLPAAYAGKPVRYGVADPTSSTYTLNAKVAQQYLSLANSPELSALPWPAGVDTLTFGLDTPAAVATFYGDQQQGFGIVQMGQLPSGGPGAGPMLKLPAELDVNAFRSALLALPGLPADTVAQVKGITDWEKTLIIPVPQDATTKNVTVNGNVGLLISDAQGTHTLVLWQANGMLFAVGGTLTETEVMGIATNLIVP